MYVAPSGVHGDAVVFVFLTLKATGSDVTLTALAAAAATARRQPRNGERAAAMIASRGTVGIDADPNGACERRSL